MLCTFIQVEIQIILLHAGMGGVLIITNTGFNEQIGGPEKNIISLNI